MYHGIENCRKYIQIGTVINTFDLNYLDFETLWVVVTNPLVAAMNQIGHLLLLGPHTLSATVRQQLAYLHHATNNATGHNRS